MIENGENFNSSPIRKITAKTNFFDGTALINTFTEQDKIISCEVERVGENSKFFGFGVFQKCNVHLIDVNRQLDFHAGQRIKASLDNFSFPSFYITEVHRDENTNELSITGYDKLLYKLDIYKVSELSINTSYTIKQFIEAVADKMEIPVLGLNGTEFDILYSEGANFSGEENLKEALDFAAEATQTIYYIDKDDTLVFKSLSENITYTINKDNYFTLENKSNRRLQTIAATTELGDNVQASTSLKGSTQIIQDNPFYNMRTDLPHLLEAAIQKVGNFTIARFDCEWRGNPALEIGDKIALITKDNAAIYSFLLNESLKFDGGLTSNLSWDYEDGTSEADAPPTTLGEAIKNTVAKVDKVEQKISLIAQDVNESKSDISQLILDTNSISGSVESLSNTMNDSNAALSDDIRNLQSKVSATMTSEQVKIEIAKEMSNGVTKVRTEKGFEFGDNGLIIRDSTSDLNSTLTENGLEIKEGSITVLHAYNEGVEARNLHASTYLIIGETSRFEDLNGRTCCFWIGN